MDVYDNLMQSLGEEYSLVRQLRSDGQNSVSVWRHNSSGRWYVLRRFEGGCEAYKKLLGVASPHLPQIYEAASSGGLSAVLEEYVCGDTLSFLIEEGALPADAARAVARQLCAALWILHSRGVVHRDIKPENVIVRGSEAVLIDLGAARIYKCGGSGDTQVLGTGLRRAGAVRPGAVGRAGGHILPRRAAERHAHGPAPLLRDGGRAPRARDTKMHNDKPGQEVR